MEMPDLTLIPNVPVVVPVVLKNWSALSGFQFEITFDPAKMKLEHVELVHSKLLNNNHLSQSSPYSFSVSWDDGQAQPAAGDSVLLLLHLLPKQAGTLQEATHLSVERLRPEGYAGEMPGISPLALRFTTTPASGRNAQSTWQCFPNPFSEEVTFSFELNEPGTVHLLIWDAAGRPVLSRETDLPAGSRQWRIDGSELPGPGAYQCRLETAGQTFTGGILILVR